MSYAIGAVVTSPSRKDAGIVISKPHGDFMSLGDFQSVKWESGETTTEDVHSLKPFPKRPEPEFLEKYRLLMEVSGL